MQIVLPVQDLNVRAMKKWYQLSFCRLLSMAAKGFIAQAGAEGYDANTVVMDLLAMHGNDITTPLNVNTHDFLVLFKEAAGLMITPFPTILHNLTDVINKVNGDAQAGALGNNNKNLARTTAARMTTMMRGNDNDDNNNGDGSGGNYDDNGGNEGYNDVDNDGGNGCAGCGQHPPQTHNGGRSSGDPCHLPEGLGSCNR
jgi:hypothetical protein